MSSPTWTLAGLSSELRPYEYREVWRLVEAQRLVSTMKLVNNLAEQSVLEDLIEATKPAVPNECQGLHFLLSTPFRYAPYRKGSRFRRAGFSPGVFYAAEEPRTAAAEIAFYRLLFFAESPDTPWPVNPFEFTDFSVGVQSLRSNTILARRLPMRRARLARRFCATSLRAIPRWAASALLY
jgi:hypothetical protein